MRTFSRALSHVDPGPVSAPPHRRRLDLDGATPESLLPRLGGRRRLLFLDSALADPDLGGRSYLGWDPLLFVTMTGREGRIDGPEAGRSATFRGDPFEVLDALWRLVRERTRGRRRALHPRGFETGLAGVFGYDLRLHLERLPSSSPRDSSIPDLAVGFYDRLLVHDASDRTWTSIGSVRPALGASDLPSAPTTAPENPRVGRMRASVDRRGHMSRVRRIVSLVHEGEVYQVNLSRRLTAPFSGDPIELYRRLRRANPGAYAGYLDTGHGSVLSTSPERFLRVERGHVRTWPVKGTRPRSEDRREDARLRRELRSSEKDHAELSMIVDLLRNDLHRVARTGSVRVTRHAFTRSYSSVHHLMSEVTADLAPRVTPVDLLRATFPGGSVTGAPKIRACEIIDDLEPVRRGAYTGAMGWIGRDGDCDLGILIRTVQIEQGRLHLHTGGGIVADSDPVAEYAETEDKARTLRRALREAAP